MEKYIEKLIDRIDYKDEQTKKRMEYLKITAIEDINKKKLIRRNKNEEKKYWIMGCNNYSIDTWIRRGRWIFILFTDMLKKTTRAFLEIYCTTRSNITNI